MSGCWRRWVRVWVKASTTENTGFALHSAKPFARRPDLFAFSVPLRLVAKLSVAPNSGGCGRGGCFGLGDGCRRERDAGDAAVQVLRRGLVPFAAHAPAFAPAALEVWVVFVRSAVNAAQVCRARVVVGGHVGLNVGRAVCTCPELKLPDFAALLALALRRAPAARWVLRAGGAAGVGLAPLLVGQGWCWRDGAAGSEKVFLFVGGAAKDASILVCAPAAGLVCNARVGVLAGDPAGKLRARVVGVGLCFDSVNAAAITLVHFLLVCGTAFDAPASCRAPPAAVEDGAAGAAHGSLADVCNTGFASLVVIAAASHPRNLVVGLVALRLDVRGIVVSAVGQAAIRCPAEIGPAVEATPCAGGNVVVQLFGGAEPGTDC